MPTNKNALIRYKYLDKLLSDYHHFYDIHDLTEKVNDMLYEDGFSEVTQRCIEKDLNTLEYAPFSAPIERFTKNGKRCIAYSKRSFSIFTKELSDEEAILLREVLNTIGQFDGLDNFKWLDDFKIGLGLEERRQIISFSNNPYLQNSNLLGTLFDQISNKVVVPEAFFKVVLCMVGKPKAFGVVVRNNEGTKKRALYYNSVDDVERLTGLDFFPSLPDDIEKVVEAEVNMDEWR